MTLTVIEIKSAKLKEKPYKMADEKGLYLLVNEAFRMRSAKYTYN